MTDPAPRPPRAFAVGDRLRTRTGSRIYHGTVLVVAWAYTGEWVYSLDTVDAPFSPMRVYEHNLELDEPPAPAQEEVLP